VTPTRREETPAALPSLSAKEAEILELVVGAERFGLELVTLSGGSIRRGTVYVTLGRMEEKGFVRSRPDPSQPGVTLPRRLYRATALGEAALASRQALSRLVARGAR
jgi:DNA-binding PadR family transcriptional regulator